MKSITVGTLYSGSKGNATLISTGSTSILIDAGCSAKQLTTALLERGLEPCDIDAIFLTHSHTDHTSALKVWCSRHHTPIHATAPVLDSIDRDTAIACGISHPIMYSVVLGDITVSSFPTEHDSAGSVGYRVDVEDEGEVRSVGVATDLGVVTECVKSSLCGCTAAVIESNHDRDMLLCGPYPMELKLRVSSKNGHLSNEEGAALASFLASNGATHIILAHISEINNTPQLAQRTAEAELGDKLPSIQLAVADQKHAVVFTI